jgi:16S rRNA (cytosine967-C5)-methyltransferase
LEGHPPLKGLTSVQHGWFYVQDPSTALAVMRLGAKPGETVLDMCAAPGGKATYIAQQMRNEGRVVALEPDTGRRDLLRKNCERLGATCVEVWEELGRSRKPFDRVLVDAPCSNTGVIRRRVDVRSRVSLNEIARLTATQKELLHRAAEVLKPGGILVYSTCSLEPEENEETVKAFLTQHPKFRLLDERTLLPFKDGVDGAYVARLESAPPG